MKKPAIALAIISVLFTFSGCGGSAETKESPEKETPSASPTETASPEDEFVSLVQSDVPTYAGSEVQALVDLGKALCDGVDPDDSSTTVAALQALIDEDVPPGEAGSLLTHAGVLCPEKASAMDYNNLEVEETPSAVEALNLPKGYPKVVPVSSLPSQVRSWYEMDESTKEAVAVAPGVWAPMSPGATVEDVIAAGVFDGFCASKKAFERKHLNGEETGGTCW